MKIIGKRIISSFLRSVLQLYSYSLKHTHTQTHKYDKIKQTMKINMQKLFCCKKNQQQQQRQQQ